MKEICKKQECVGCGACLSACSKNAISMQPDQLGFLYPVIDQKKCIDCGLCVKSCFNNQKPQYNEPLHSFVGYATDSKEQITSTSGGLASVFMRSILKEGGVVYGCSGDDARAVKHIRIENIEDIYKLKGSKYVQSYMGLTYKNVTTDLKTGRTVLFIGTPCQVGGLKTYLKGKTYNNLFTVDFVCHGVPSQTILNDAIKGDISDCDGLRLLNRVKENGKESKYTLRLLKNDEVVYDDKYPSMGYITGFLCGLYYRENCYQCKFSQRERVSDVTLGDFWDRNNIIDEMPNKKNGLSMIIVNTEAGDRLLEICGNSYKAISWEYEDFIKRNGQLKQPIKRHVKRDEFEHLYCSKGYEYALNKTLRNDLKKIRKSFFLNAIASLVHRTPIVKSVYNIIRNK